MVMVLGFIRPGMREAPISYFVVVSGVNDCVLYVIVDAVLKVMGIILPAPVPPIILIKLFCHWFAVHDLVESISVVVEPLEA